MRGYKGFDKDLKCRGLQYEVGAIMIHDANPRVCSNGFHFSHRLEDVFQFYSNDGENRFCEVEAVGRLSHSDGMSTDQVISLVESNGDNFPPPKSATDRLKIIREIPKEEMGFLMVKPYLDFYKKHLSKHTAIGGSLALMLQGEMEYRQLKDIDVCSEKPVHKKFKEFERRMYMASETDRDIDELDKIDMSTIGTTKVFDSRRIHGITVDFFVDPEMKQREVIVQGEKYYVQDAKRIWQAKFEYARSKGISWEKHINDLMKADKLKLDI